MHSIHPFGHHTHDEVNHLLAETPFLLAVRPQMESHEPVLPHVQHAVLAEIHEGPYLVGYLLDPRLSLPVPVEQRQHLEDMRNVQLGIASMPHHEVEHQGYQQSYEHHEEGHRGGILHNLTDQLRGREHHGGHGEDDY